MRKIIIDSNIIFSALRGTESRTRNKLLNSKDQYFTPNFLIVEVFKYKDLILEKSGASEEETLNFLSQLSDYVKM